MYMRVSTFKTAPDGSGEPTDETVQRVLAIPGCKGFYYLSGDQGKALALTLWADKDALDGSRDAAKAIRAESAAEQRMEILGVEEYEVLRQEGTG
ncbi:hypothetical protein [Sinomonas halotolerans]|uniref:ABM domain-containing protein n=1 Tax=Sinomonas halotolerans TaxID=1644133 RepID=A0ABU9X2V6_9MICC